MNRITAMLLRMSAADDTVLERCPTERRKFALTGGLVLTAATFAALSATVTLHDFLHLPFAIAVLIALFWGAAIMNIDRWLLVSIRRQRSPWLTVTMALPRLFLAVVVGLFVAQPLVLRAFQGEINRQVNHDKKEELKTANTQLEARYHNLQKLLSEKADLQQTVTMVATRKNVVQNPQYQELTKELSTLEGHARQAENAATCELDGTCGTQKLGRGPVFGRKREVEEKRASRVEEKKHERVALVKELTSQEERSTHEQRDVAKRQLPLVNKEVHRLQADKVTEERENRGLAKQHPGLLDRIEALDRLAARKPAIRYRELLMWLVVLAFDTLPAFAKTLMSLGRPSLYEQVQDEIEEEAVDAVQADRRANKQAHDLKAETIISAAETRKEFELNARNELTDKIVQAQKRAAEAYVDAWKATIVPLAEKWAKDWAQEFKDGVQKPGGSRNGQKTNRAQFFQQAEEWWRQRNQDERDRNHTRNTP
jgi:Domain of unknown function (DUF4407)